MYKNVLRGFIAAAAFSATLAEAQSPAWYTQSESLGAPALACIEVSQGGVCQSTGPVQQLASSTSSSFTTNSGPANLVSASASASFEGSQMVLRTSAIGGGSGVYQLAQPVNGVLLYGTQSSASASIQDTYSISPRTSDTFIDWSLELEGSSSLSAPTAINTDAQFRLSFGSNSFNFSLFDLMEDGQIPDGSVTLFGSFLLSRTTESIPVQMFMYTAIGAGEAAGSFIDFGNTARLTLDFDPSLTVTRASGMPTSPVPLPGALLLLASGAGLFGAASRRRLLG